MNKIYIAIIIIIAIVTAVILLIKPTTKSPENKSSVNNEPTLSYKNISAEELSTKMEDKNFVLINVHTPHQQDLPDTDMFIPYDQVALNIDKLPQDKNKEIVVYCRSGNMSQTASQDLVDLGYTNVTNLVGGMKAWSTIGKNLINVN